MYAGRPTTGDGASFRFLLRDALVVVVHSVVVRQTTTRPIIGLLIDGAVGDGAGAALDGSTLIAVHISSSAPDVVSPGLAAMSAPLGMDFRICDYNLRNAFVGTDGGGAFMRQAIATGIDNGAGNGYRPAGVARASYSGCINKTASASFCMHGYVAYRDSSAVYVIYFGVTVSADGGSVATARNAQDIFFLDAGCTVEV